MRNLKEAFEDENLVERGLFARDPDGMEIVGTPLRFADEPARIDASVPGLSEHADAILGRLGYEADAIAALKDQGVV